jgi:hypothetical protein
MRQLKLHHDNVMKQGEKSSNSDRFRSPSDKHNPYSDVSDAKASETKQRLSLPNMPQREFRDNCYIS